MVKFYSYSKISTFEKCPYKFKLRYIDKIPPEIKGTIEVHLGIAVHQTLEWLYKEVMQKNIPELDNLIIYYKNFWQKKYNSNILIVKKNLTERDYFNKGVTFLINYYTQNSPFNEGTIECEKKVVFNLDEKGNYKLQGFIDRFAYNLEKEEYEIHDYKTANYLPSDEEMHKDKQLALYCIAIKEYLSESEKDKEISLNWHYLAHSKKISIKKTIEQLENLREEVIKIIEKIELTEYFPKKSSRLCDWCEYKALCKKSEISESIYPDKIIEKEPVEIKKEFPVMNYKERGKNTTLDIW